MKVKIKPAEGLIIRDPKNMKLVPSEGIEVEINSFWQRRLNDGDMLLVQEKKQAPKVEEPKVEKKKIGE